jgi:hypothetical protein
MNAMRAPGQRQHEEMLRQVIDVSPLQMFILEADATGSYGNRASREYFGAIPPMDPFEFIELVTHPEDVDRLREDTERNVSGRGFGSGSADAKA